MDAALAELERRARAAPGDAELQSELARRLLRAGRRVEAYLAWFHAGLVEAGDPGAVELGKELAREQTSALEVFEDRWPRVSWKGKGRVWLWGSAREALDRGLPVMALQWGGARRQRLSREEGRSIRALTTLTYVSFHNADFTDTKLKHLTPLRHLRTLLLDRNGQLTGATLSGLSLGGLVELNLDGNRKVNDEALGHVLAATPPVRVLRLGTARVTDAGIAALRNVATLTTLNLERTRITDAGIAHLSGLANLTDLNLSGFDLTDEGLRHLTGLTALETLDIRDTPIAGPGLEHLHALADLRRLTLSRGKVDPRAIEALEIANPKLEIEPRTAPTHEKWGRLKKKKRKKRAKPRRKRTRSRKKKKH